MITILRGKELPSIAKGIAVVLLSSFEPDVCVFFSPAYRFQNPYLLLHRVFCVRGSHPDTM